MTTNYCSILKEFLEEVKAGNMRERNVGLCSNLNDFCLARCPSYHEIDGVKKIFRKMLCDFPKYTGSPLYPLVPRDKYDAHLRAGIDFFDITQPQGEIRHEFIDWALEEIAQNRVSYMKS